VDASKQISTQPTLEGIDFNKLKIVVRNNWMWLAILFVIINAAAYLFIRYTKDLYESESELKLEVKDDASALGFRPVVEDQNLNLLSGEIEIIQSKLFLSQVLDSANLEVSYYSIGRVLNDELFLKRPFEVQYQIKNPGYYNIPIYFDEEDARTFSLRIGNDGAETKGRYDEPIHLDGLTLTLIKTNDFIKGDEIGYFFVINSREMLLNYCLNNLTAEPLNFNANTIRVSFKDHNPFKAQAILSRIDSVYLHFSNEQKNLANKQKIDWLSNELTAIEKKMEGYEDYFENFTLQNKTNNLDEDLTRTIGQIAKIDSQRYDVTQRIQRADQLIAHLKSNDYNLPYVQRQVYPDALIKNLDLLQELALEQEKLKLSYSERTFAFRQKEKELQTIGKKSLEELEEIRAEWAKRLHELNSTKARLETEFADLPDKNTQFSKNLRFYKLNEQFYLSLMQSRSQFEIAQAGNTPDFKILSPASLPQTPIAPKKTMIAAAAFVMSFVCMIFFIGISYLLNNKITGLYELERLAHVPLLGVVPASRATHGEGLQVLDRPKSMVSEAIRTLRTNLDFFNVQSSKKVIAISSTISGEGKSFIAMNLGGIMALSRKKVILLDLDLRKPKEKLPFAVEDKSKGVSTVLIRKNAWQECIIKTPIETFDYLPSGPHPPNPSELLLNGEFEDLLHDLKKHYDYILLDTPPVGLVTDGIMAMKRADISIYIFRANYSKKDFLANMQRIININKFSNITMVLNALPSQGKTSYGYGYYEEQRPANLLKRLISR
jgi:capsular exopolysaccharide synthesis family protein